MSDRLPPNELDWLPVAAALVERDGTVLAVNPPLARLLGTSPAAGDTVAALGLDRHWRAVVAAVTEGHGFAKDIELARQTVRVTAALRGRQVLAIFNELAPRPAVASGPQRLESLGMVAGDLAHEFNNQLVGVIADASMLREEDDLSDPGREAVLRIEAAARRMSQLSRQLLAFAGRGRFVTMLLDPDALLAESHDRFESLVRPGAKLAVDIAGGGGIAIEADRGLLRQVIADLIENASEALPATDGEIRVASRVVVINGSPHWELEVCDNGRGIEPSTLSRIFDPFFSTKAEHRGLGLSAALGIVRRLGGDLECESRVDHGATFRVRLPVVPGAVAPRRRPTSQQPPLAKLTGLRVLVADDEPTIRATVRRMLERRGAVPVLAADGEEAAQLLRTEKFDVVLLDVMMPKRTGYQLVPIVRELQPNVPVILMSGYTDQAHGVEPPDTFLEKPFNASMLEAAIQGALRG
ncbi:MAG: response regulator [Deltaproteobacteria bacterium]|nr:response regulator [Deltaproteobacteria bacterium]